MTNYAGMKWSELSEKEQNELLLDANAIDGITGNNMTKSGECIIDFTDFGYLSISGKIEITENEDIIIIDDDAIFYSSSDEFNEKTLKNLIGQTVCEEDNGMTIESLLIKTCNIVSEQCADGWAGKRTYSEIYEAAFKEDYGYRFSLNGLNYFIYVNEDGVITGVE